jgi:hypothetical protein
MHQDPNPGRNIQEHVQPGPPCGLSSVKGSINMCGRSADVAPLPRGCTVPGVGAVALALLRALPQPLIPKETATRLTAASKELLLRPKVPHVAYYVGKCSLEKLKPEAQSASGVGHSPGPLACSHNFYQLLKGIVHVLVELADHSQVRCCGPNSERRQVNNAFRVERLIWKLVPTMSQYWICHPKTGVPLHCVLSAHLPRPSSGCCQHTV